MYTYRCGSRAVGGWKGDVRARPYDLFLENHIQISENRLHTPPPPPFPKPRQKLRYITVHFKCNRIFKISSPLDLPFYGGHFQKFKSSQD